MDPAAAAQQWLNGVHGGRVGLVGPQPVLETAQMWAFGCAAYTPDRQLESGVMLAATVAVPKDGSPPMHLTNTDPWTDLQTLPPLPPERQVFRMNALSCAVAGDASFRGQNLQAGPWQPSDEAPGWWHRLVAGHLQGAQVFAYPTWDDVIRAIAEGGLGTRGIVWVRRHVNGVEFTGHLINVQSTEHGVVLLDFQSGALATLEQPQYIRQLVLTRCLPS